MDAFYGEIRLFPYNYIPQNWAACNGQQMAIAQYALVYAILGTTFGGDGRVTFNLPNLNASAVIGSGNGNGLTPRPFGKAVGANTTTLTLANMPAHNHAITVADGTDGAIQNSPANNAYLQSPRQSKMFNMTPTAGCTLASSTVGAAGQAAPVNNMQPYLNLVYCMCVSEGFWPEKP